MAFFFGSLHPKMEALNRQAGRSDGCGLGSPQTGLQVTILNSGEVNAFRAPTGQLYVTSGLIGWPAIPRNVSV